MARRRAGRARRVGGGRGGPGGGRRGDPRRRRRADAGARRRDRADDRPRRRRVRRRGRGAARARGPLGAFRPDVLGRRRHGARRCSCRTPAGSCSKGIDRAIDAVVATRGGAPRHDLRSAARTGSTPSRPRSAGSSPAGRSSSTARATRVARALERNRVGQLSGTVGTYAAVEPEVERIACERLGLEPDPLSTQVIARDRHAELLGALALCADVARAVRRRDPAPRAHRGARGRGAVRPRG